MWKYLTKEEQKKYILSSNLIEGDFSDEKKLNILYAIANNPEKYYTKKYIAKKDGTKRELLVPNRILKSIQKNILKNILYNLDVSKYATAYVKGKSVKDNAKVHVGKKTVLKLDLKDFFKNILFEDIYKALPNTIFPPFMKVLIIKLCTYNDYLPQGAPTSPYLSNLVMKHFDNYIGKFCKENNINYTRYSDDLTFSGDFNYKKLKNKVQAFIEDMGYNINDKKTKVLMKNNCQIITGVVVNEKLNTKRYRRKNIRLEMYYINKFGLEHHLSKIGLEKNFYLRSLLGRINYVLLIDESNERMKYYRKIIKSML